jgi:hypothetical protein
VGSATADDIRPSLSEISGLVAKSVLCGLSMRCNGLEEKSGVRKVNFIISYRVAEAGPTRGNIIPLSLRVALDER